MTLTNNSTYKEFQTTNFYKSMKNYVMTQSLLNSEPFTQEKAEEFLNLFYWRSYNSESLQGIS